MLQNATSLRKSPPWSPNTSNSCVACTAPATRNASFQIVFKCPTPAIVLNCYKTLTFCSLFTRHTIPCACQAKRHLNVQKCSVPFSFLALFATACTFSTCQLPKVFQSWGVCTCWLGNVLRATTAWTFSTCQRPKVVRAWCALYILTSKCAPHHKGVQLFISHLARWLLLFDPPEPQIIGKNTVNIGFSTFSRTCIFFLLTPSLLWSSLLFSSLTLLTSAFHLSILSEVDF